MTDIPPSEPTLSDTGEQHTATLAKWSRRYLPGQAFAEDGGLGGDGDTHEPLAMAPFLPAIPVASPAWAPVLTRLLSLVTLFGPMEA